MSDIARSLILFSMILILINLNIVFRFYVELRQELKSKTGYGGI